MTTVNYTELATACRKKDRAAMSLLYERYAARVYRLSYRYVLDVETARDLTQECFIRIFDKIGKYDSGRGTLDAWISRIAANAAIDHLRRARKLRRQPIDDSLDVAEVNEEKVELVPPEKLMEFLSRLPAAKRALINLYYFENMSHKEIARMLGMREKSSSSLLFKARSQLARMINEYLEDLNHE